MDKHIARVQLEGRDLEHIRKQHAAAKEALLHIGQHTLKLLGVDRKIKAVLVIHNNDKMLFFDDAGNVAGVEEDPPGVCREPTQDEHDNWDGGGF
jgi:hypothetical protein